MRIVASLLLLLAAAAAHAQAWPTKPVRVVVAFAPGGSLDFVTRIIAERLSQDLGQQFVVENRAGASGAIGSDIVAKAAPDGYTMGLMTASTHALAPALGAKLPYDTVKDFKPVSMIFDRRPAVVG